MDTSASIYQTLRAVSSLSVLPDYHLAQMTARYKVDPRTLSYDRRTHTISFKELDLSITGTNNLFVLPRLRYYKDLVTYSNAKFYENENGVLYAEVNGIKVEIRTGGDIGPLWEIYSQGIYNMDMPQGTVIWDIGMNIGLASLFFVGCKGVTKVYGYEPFPKTVRTSD